MEYTPSTFLRAERDISNPPTANLLILNQPLQDFQTFKQVWSHTRYCICADGGANRLYDMLSGPLRKYRTEFVIKYKTLSKFEKTLIILPASQFNPRRPRLSQPLNRRFLPQKRCNNIKRWRPIQHRFRQMHENNNQRLSSKFWIPISQPDHPIHGQRLPTPRHNHPLHARRSCRPRPRPPPRTPPRITQTTRPLMAAKRTISLLPPAARNL